MEKIDKIVFGDNQFFGINHRSQEKAEEMLKRSLQRCTQHPEGI